MYVLDSNIIIYYLAQPQNYPYLAGKMREADTQRLLCTTIVNAQEIIAGRLHAIKDRPDQKQQVIIQLYDNLFQVIDILKRLRVLPFDEAAYERFKTIAALQKVIGTRDRRIAAIALANDATVVTANQQHFDLVPDLKVINWTIPPSA
ncbi:MAG: type II toxin-antitoxin system VapC family toxin [Blastocatellia bacterium]|nr:type II toxin-antitoxin system VapC family toxin [Blastocatellia bacterium]